MAIELFGLSIGRSKSQKKEERVKSFVPPTNEDGAIVVEAGGFYGQYVDLDGSSRNDYELIQKYREMSIHPEIEGATEDIVNEAIVADTNKPPVRIILDDLQLDGSIKGRITEEFDKILRLLNFDTKGYELFRRWYIDGRLYFHVIVDEKHKKNGIVELRFVDPLNLQKIREYEKKTKEDGSQIVTGYNDFYIYNKDMSPANTFGKVGGSSGTTGLKISPDAIAAVTSGLYDTEKHRVVSYLQKAIKPLNQLRMMEDAVVIYRIARAPERRIFYVDVGNLPKQKAEEYVRGLMNRYKNKLVYDVNTGEIRDDKRYMSMLEDYWMPRREGGKGTEIDTLSGGQNLGEMEDVEYFQKKLYQSLNVPVSRLQEDNGFVLGRSAEISRDEVKFSKFVSRLRIKFSELFFDLLYKQLVLRGIITRDDWVEIKDKVHFDFLRDTFFAELKEAEVRKERIDELRDISEYVGKYYSHDWIRKNVLGQTQEDIEKIDKEIENERKQGLIAVDNTEYGY